MALGDKVPPFPSEGIHNSENSASLSTWAAVNAKKSESKRTKIQEPIRSGRPCSSPMNRGAIDSCRRSASRRRCSVRFVLASAKKVWRSMPCCAAIGVNESANSRTRFPTRRPSVLRSLAKSRVFGIPRFESTAARQLTGSASNSASRMTGNGVLGNKSPQVLGLYRERSGEESHGNAGIVSAGAFSIQRLERSRFGTVVLWVLNGGAGGEGWGAGESMAGGHHTRPS